MFVFEVLEIARRTAWAVFRIEWEVIAKIIYPSGSYQAVTLQSITADDGEDELED